MKGRGGEGSEKGKERKKKKKGMKKREERGKKKEKKQNQKSNGQKIITKTTGGWGHSQLSGSMQEHWL